MPSATRVTWNLVGEGATALSPSQRLEVASHFKSQTVTMAHDGSQDACATGERMDDFFDRIQVEFAKGGVDKDSASASIVIAAMLRQVKGNPHVFIKLSFGNRRDALFYERLIYCRVTQPLLRMHITPCVVPFLGYVQVRNQFQKCIAGSSSGAPASVCDAIQAMSQKEIGRGRKPLDREMLSHGHALITEISRQGVTMKDWQQLTHTVDEWQDVWFQLVFTLMCFAQIKLTHWDLHNGNVFIDDLGQEVDTAWIVTRDHVRVMRSRWLVKIYDFDRSCKLAAPGMAGFTEPVINEAMRRGMYPSVYGGQGTWDPRVDYARIAAAVVSTDNKAGNAIPAKFRAQLDQTINYGALTNPGSRLSWSGTLCYVSSVMPEGSPCQIDPRKSARFCKSPGNLLHEMLNYSQHQLLGSVSTWRDAQAAVKNRNVYVLPEIQGERMLFMAQSVLYEQSASTASSTTSSKIKSSTATPKTKSVSKSTATLDMSITPKVASPPRRKSNIVLGEHRIRSQRRRRSGSSSGVKS